MTELKNIKLPTTPNLTIGSTTAAYYSQLKHDLRTPLNHIVGYSEMLMEEVQESGLHAYTANLRRINNEAYRVLNLINEAFSTTKLENAPLNPTFLRIELRTPLRQILLYAEMTRDEAKRHNHANLLPDLEKIQTANNALLSMIDTVLTSAATFTSTGGPASTATAILASLHPWREETSRTDTARLLVVDDNETNRDIILRRLARQGYAITTATNGREALECVQTAAFDAILLDVVMPDLNGYEVLTQLKSDARLRDIPVIIISSLDEVDSVVKCIELGAEDYLTKPFNQTLLRARIGSCLEKKRLRDQELLHLQQLNEVARLATALQKGGGNFAALSEIASRKDEIGQLAQTIQQLVGQLQPH